MHDGQMLFDSTTTWNGQEWGIDETLSHLIRNGDVPPTIVVGISNTQNRHSEYFPQKPFESQTKARQDSLIADAKRGQNSLFASPIYSDRYLSFLVDELKPFVDERYATETTPEHTFIGGSSMGGLISLYALTEYPEVFGGAACLSTHWIGTFESTANTFPGLYLRYLEEHLPKPETHKMYFDYGTVGLDSLYEPYQLKVDELMNKLGYNDRNWLSRKYEGADHSERSWKARLSIPLIFLLN
jgi:enterochelin esterase-like enzyme